MKKKFFNIDVEKLLQHIQKCQYAFLALSFSILLLASASPAKPPALEELDKLENLLGKIGDRWIDKFFGGLRPDINDMTGQIEVMPADKIKMKIDSPNGVMVDSTIASNLVSDLSAGATNFMYRDALALFSDNRKRGIPPLWNNTETLLSFDNKGPLGSRTDYVKSLSLEDIGNLWKKYSEQRKLTFINKVTSFYIADEDPSLNTSLEINKIPIQVRKQEITTAMMTTFSRVKRTGKLWNANSDWVLKENGNVVARKRIDNTLIYALPEDGNQTLKNAVFFIVGLSSQNADLFEPLQKISLGLGIEIKSRFEETFPELSKQNNGRKEEPLSKLRSDLVAETKDPGREINAEVLGIKIAGLNVWWLLPLSLLLVQAYCKRRSNSVTV